MNCKPLYIFVEGDDDERFFQEIVIPILKRKYAHVKIIKYAQKPKKFEYITKFIKSIQSMGGDYIYVTDINTSPCITAKKENIRHNVPNISNDKIIVVVKEIESWYLAGLNKSFTKNLGIKIPSTTNTVTKEQFYRLILQKFNSHIDFMREILKNFSIEDAKEKNKSFKYLMEKYDC